MIALRNVREKEPAEAAVNELDICVSNETEASFIEKVAHNPYVILIVTKLDPHRLPEHIRAIICTEARMFSAPQLRTSGHIVAGRAESLIIPQLRTSGTIFASSAAGFSAPELERSGDIYISNAKSFSAPRLQLSGTIAANNLAEFVAPELHTSGDIIAGRASNFSVPRLRKSGVIYTPKQTAVRPETFRLYNAPADAF